jgi:ABC-type antimicrobial peptide transport system permease subunit
MFLVYLRRELRRRMRQAIFIALGLALGIGLVITVTAASDGVKNSQAAVLHTLYGLGTDLTVTRPPAPGQSRSIGFSFRQQIKADRTGGASVAGAKVNINNLINSQYGTLTAGQLAEIARQPHVTAAAGGLTLVDGTVTGTIPPASVKKGSGGGISSYLNENSFTVDGVDLTHPAAGPLGAARLTSGTMLTAADANADVALVDSGYAQQNRLTVGGTLDVGGTTFKITGIVSAPQGGSPPDVYIPLAKAQSLGKTGNSGLAGQVNTIYVTADSAANISSVQASISKTLPGVTVTDASDLASQVTGSISSASTLANNLGTWLLVAVLTAAFGLASLLTMAAVSRRVREFGTLKALGWPSRRIIGQVMGESIATGVAGGVAGVGLGYLGAALIGKLAPKLSATVGASNAASAAAPGSTKLGSALRALSNPAHTISVTLTAPVTIGTIGLAVVLAIAGGLIAGSFGGWRAARLRPAAAMARVE